MCQLRGTMSEISEVKRTIGHFLLNYFWQPNVLIAKFISAVFECALNCASIKLWYAIGCFFLFYLFASGAGLVIEYICGGTCFIIKQIIDFVSEIASFLTMSTIHYDVKAIDALAALVDGQCNQFKNPSVVLNYWWIRFIGTSLCDKLRWYETITLTRIFISQPLGIVLFQDQMDMKCNRVSTTNDMCAGVIGSLSLLNWMIATGIWLFVACVIFAPILKFVLYVIKLFVRVMYTEIFCLLYSVTHCQKE